MTRKLKTASITDRLGSLGSDLWHCHFEGRRRAQAGEPIIQLTIGEPDIPTPDHLLDVADHAMRNGRTRYSGGRGEPSMLEAVAAKYSKRAGRAIGPENVITMPGTQAALAFSVLALVEKGEGVLVPDPFYATYQGVVRAGGADFIPVSLDSANGFHLTVDQLQAALTPNARVLLLNSPHNPTGAVLSAKELEAIGRFCADNGLWVVCDEVYEFLVYKGAFASLFDFDAFAERAIACASISKSHAAPGFRSGWAVGPEVFIKRLQAVAETFFFGGQPFISDMTAHALTHEDDTAQRMSANYQRRIAVLEAEFADCAELAPLAPEAGMFMLVDVSKSGAADGAQFANRLLDEYEVSVMPGGSFGERAKNFIRLSLTVEEDELKEAARRIVKCARDWRD